MEEQRGDWIKYTQNSSQSGEDEVYYYNVVTQESQWDAPEEFKDVTSENSQNVSTTESNIREPKDLTIFMKEIGLDKQTNIKSNSLQLLYDGCQKYGTDDNWKTFMKYKDYQLLKIVIFIFASTKDINERVAAFKFLFYLSQLDTNVLGLFKYEKLLSLKTFYEIIGTSLLQNKEDNLLPALVFLESILSYDIDNSIKFFPTSSFIKVLFDYIQGKEEVYFNVVLCIAVDISYYCTKVEKNAFLKYIMEGQYHYISTALLTQLNSLGTPVKNPIQLKMLLICLCECFSNTNNRSLFLTNDIHLLIDIIIREVLNLPRDDFNRTLYLYLLEAVLQTSEWKEKDRYRFEDIFTVLHDLTYLEGVEETARIQADSILLNYLNYLQQ